MKNIHYISRWQTGLVTQRSPLSSPLAPLGVQVVQKTDALIDGQDVELTNAETLKRRPGLTKYCSATVNKPLGFYSFRNIAGTTKLMVDTLTKVQTFTTSAVTDVFTKGTTAKTRFQSVANMLYMCNGTDLKKWDGTTLTNWGIATPVLAPTLAISPVSYTNAPASAAGTNWTNPTNALTTNATYAIYNAATQDLLKLTNFSFALPVLAVITGFLITVTGNGTSATTAQRQIQVGITKDGTTLAGTWQTLTLNQTTDTTLTIGGSTNLLGATATRADAQASTFGIVVRDADVTGATLNIDSATLTVYFTVTPGISPLSGYRYVYAYKNSSTGHISTASPVSATTGALTNKQVTVSGTGSADTQVDYVSVYRTLDGGSLFYFLADIANPGNTSFSYADTTLDTGLNVLISAPVNHSNDSPPAGATNVSFHMGRLWLAVGNKVYFGGGPDTITGVPEEAWPSGYVFVFPGSVTTLISTAQGLLVGTATDLFIIRGYDTFSFFSQKLMANFGIVDQDCVAQDGDILFVYTATRQLYSMSESLAEVGFLVGDYLKTNFDPSSSYLKLHRSGPDSGLFLSDGSTKLMRYNVARNTWCPTGKPVGGVNAIASLGVGTSDFRLVVGRAADAGYILYRDTTVAQDDLSNMASAFATIGTIMAAPLGETTPLSAVLVERKSAGGDPDVAVLLNEISGSFVSLPKPVLDSPHLPASTTVVMKRHYLNAAQTPLAGHIRHLQVKISFPAENAQNELLGLALMPPA